MPTAQRFIDKGDIGEGQPQRRIARKLLVDQIFVERKEVDAALDLFELAEFAWHDRYGEGPPEEVINEMLARSSRLADLVMALKSAVETHGTPTAESSLNETTKSPTIAP